MNGLQIIRNAAMLSSEELAELLGVTKQALSAWENDRKPIPEGRLKQLSEYFRIDKRYFGTISDEEIKELSEKRMVRRDFHGHESYVFYDPEIDDAAGRAPMTYLQDFSGPSILQNYAAARQEEKDCLERTKQFIEGQDPFDLDNATRMINSGCFWINGMIHLNESAERYHRGERVAAKTEMKNMFVALDMLFDEADSEEREAFFKEIDNSDMDEHRACYHLDPVIIRKMLALLEEDWAKKRGIIQSATEKWQQKLREQREENANAAEVSDNKPAMVVHLNTGRVDVK